ncbi:MAG: FHA domain-containing protein [Planctomycetota bacterium]|nr:FHA domain-containing protein [Planctomycetota bacterium]
MNLSLAIARGRTQSPNRPVRASRFLIGSADNCHLRLGGGEIPPEHSLILVRPDGPIIEQLADAPPLLVNGRSVEEHALSHDDLIQIGRFQLDVILGAEQSAGAGCVSADHPQTGIDQLADLTDEWLSRQQAGGSQALLAEILGRADVRAKSLEHSEAEEVMAQLARFSRALTARSEQLTEREAAFREAEATLLAAQEQVEQQLERMRQHLEERNASEADGDSSRHLRIAA